MDGLNKISLKDQAYQVIKAKIMTQEYHLGEKINMRELAKEMNISSTPIREALSALEKENLVTISPFAGPSVIRLNSEIFRKTFDTVLTLLLGSYEFCLYNDKLSILVALISESVEYQRQIVNTADDYDFVRATIAVDTALVTACENSFLTSIFNSTFDVQTLILLYDYSQRYVDRYANIAEHETILNAISSGQHDEARKLLHRHYSRSIMFKT